MSRNSSISAKGIVLSIILGLNTAILASAIFISQDWLWFFVGTLPLLFLAVYNSMQNSHTILKNFPLLGYGRYFFESIRPELRQYFGESDLDGRPFNRRQRSLVYQRAKNVRQTVAFGMQEDPDKPGHDWVAHSVYPVKVEDKDLRVVIGNKQCKKPYSASILNVGAMS